MKHSALPGPISLRVSVTDRCQFRCLYCTPAEGVERFTFANTLRYEEILRFVRLIMSRVGLTKVHITGGEPLGRPGIAKLVAMLVGEGVADLAITTNGQRLGELAAELKQAGLKRVNVSLDTLQLETFGRLSGGGRLARTLAGIDAALAAAFGQVKLNTTVIRGINDHEVTNIAQFGIKRGAQARFIELMPLGPAAARHQDWFVSSSEVLDRLCDRFDLQPLPRRPGSSAREYRAADATGNTGIVGLISPCSQPFCADCRRLRLTAAGELLGCLARGNGQDILPLLRTKGQLDEARILEKTSLVMAQKGCHCGFTSNRNMLKVGG